MLEGGNLVLWEGISSWEFRARAEKKVLCREEPFALQLPGLRYKLFKWLCITSRFFTDSRQHDITYIKDKDMLNTVVQSQTYYKVLEYRHFLSADYQKEWHEIGDSGNEDPYTLFVNTRGLLQWLTSTIDTPDKEAFKR
ncbi:hypothetical protein CEXT_33251 [Caerostris extrusa]|uniref:Uncharacterized protein n=1 Tax=Caerostris extrusa TaxID=172846 RepID=A0AAV4XFT5_CAEEX|nr:hypothetical protein CEXT_33251 [Caerostris extrusa]